MSYLVTTLDAIRAARPCHDGWTKLLRHLGKTTADDATLDLLTVLDSNGLDDALWVLDNVIRNRRIISLFSADCSERVLPLFLAVRPDDARPANAIRVARDANASDAERDAARAAARAAALAAARDAALAAAWNAAWDAAWNAAWDAAWNAAWDAQERRLRQYITHGEAAADMTWPEQVEV